MNQPPTRPQLIGQLRGLIRALENQGAQAERMAPLLAARGYPSATIGDGGSRGNSELNSVERAALHRDRWVGVDEKLARFYLQTFVLVGAGQQLIADLAACAGSDVDHEGDVVHTNTNGGWCIGCGRWVPGTANDRRRGGACDACRMAYTRAAERDPHLSRALFMQNRPAYDGPDVKPVPVDPTDVAAVLALSPAPPAPPAPLVLDVDRATAESVVADVEVWSGGLCDAEAHPLTCDCGEPS